MDLPSDVPQLPSQTSQRGIPKPAWDGYLKNLGVWTGKRALANPEGRVLIDLPSRVTTQQFKTSQGDLFVLWQTALRTADAIEEGEEEWSQSELAEFGALAADGSFSIGAQVFVGEDITIDHCIFDEQWRIRTTHAFDWEGCLSGIIANRERKSTDPQQTQQQQKLFEQQQQQQNQIQQAQQLAIQQTPADMTAQQRAFIEPVAWRNPRVLFDYLLGVWEGKGICIDARTANVFQLTSRLRLAQGAGQLVTTSSILRIGEDGPTRVFEAAGKIDANVILFAEANVQMLLLPGGVYVCSPIRIRPGRPFTVETAFLMKPDCRKRILRIYNRDAEWINTTFLNERRAG